MPSKPHHLLFEPHLRPRITHLRDNTSDTSSLDQVLEILASGPTVDCLHRPIFELFYARHRLVRPIGLFGYNLPVSSSIDLVH